MSDEEALRIQPNETTAQYHSRLTVLLVGKVLALEATVECLKAEARKGSNELR